jgi:toxin ParE1/3/4
MLRIITEPALHDVEDIANYISADNPAAARKMVDAVYTTINRLCDFPQMGHIGYLSDTREFVVSGSHYVIVYQAAADTLTVLAVFHGARDLARALAERRPSE